MNSDGTTKVNTYIAGKARYVKIAVVSKNSHASMRGDVLLSRTQDPLPPVTLADSTPAQYSFSGERTCQITADVLIAIHHSHSLPIPCLQMCTPLVTTLRLSTLPVGGARPAALPAS